ncbi:hypothetical protein BKB91_01410 [Chlamydia trachomatis]|nr:hypothetical protein BKB89_01410 [Chlamydia trachomatis]ATW17267.1 hypothetical protein BKB91_01410 [Chlamydia trachomatis]
MINQSLKILGGIAKIFLKKKANFYLYKKVVNLFLFQKKVCVKRVYLQKMGRRNFYSPPHQTEVFYSAEKTTLKYSWVSKVASLLISRT